MIRDRENFATRYAQLGEPELLTLARAYDTLTAAAQAALRAEFRQRQLDPPLFDDLPTPNSPAHTLVTVRRFRDLSEAIVARSLLESAGIPVYLFDENLVRLDWQISNFLGGMRLQVEAPDAPDALDLLTQPVPGTIAFGGSTPFQQPLCPVCGSPEITFEGASRAAALTGLTLFAVPLPTGPETWSCTLCGARWEDPSIAENSDPDPSLP